MDAFPAGRSSSDTWRASAGTGASPRSEIDPARKLIIRLLAAAALGVTASMAMAGSAPSAAGGSPVVEAERVPVAPARHHAQSPAAREAERAPAAPPASGTAAPAAPASIPSEAAAAASAGAQEGATPHRDADGDDPKSPRLDWNVLIPSVLGKLIVLALAVACAFLAYAAWKILERAMAPPAAAAPAESAAFVFRRHWGGFGGSSTGWTVSERLVRVSVGLALAALAASLGMELVPQDGAHDDKAKAARGAETSPAKQEK